MYKGKYDALLFFGAGIDVNNTIIIISFNDIIIMRIIAIHYSITSIYYNISITSLVNIQMYTSIS